MEIFVSHNGQEFGPFSIEDIRAKIDAGDFSNLDQARIAGLDQWKTLGALLSAESLLEIAYTLHNRACDIESAIEVYNDILSRHPDTQEAYWAKEQLGVINRMTPSERRRLAEQFEAGKRAQAEAENLHREREAAERAQAEADNRRRQLDEDQQQKSSEATESQKLPHPPTYRVARGGVEIGQFEASGFFDAVHSGVVRLDDFVWMAGLANWIPVSDLLSPPQAKEPQIVPSANSIASVSPPKTPSKEKLASIAKGIGGLLLSTLAILVIGLVLIGGAKLAVWVQPWAEGLAGLTLGILIPLCLLLLISRKTRAYGGMGIYFASYAIGLALWIFCFLYAVGVSLFWTIVGILMAGLGIVPVAAIMTVRKRCGRSPVARPLHPDTRNLQRKAVQLPVSLLGADLRYM